MPILKLDREDEKKKIDFELDYLLSLTVWQRFQAMWSKSEETRILLLKDHHKAALSQVNPAALIR